MASPGELELGLVSVVLLVALFDHFSYCSPTPVSVRNAENRLAL